MKLNFDQKKLAELCEKYGIAYLGLFGSFARAEATSNSGVDLLVEFSETKSLFERARVLLGFQEFFGRPVDLVTKSTLKPNREPYIRKDLVSLYGKNNYLRKLLSEILTENSAKESNS